MHSWTDILFSLVGLLSAGLMVVVMVFMSLLINGGGGVHIVTPYWMLSSMADPSYNIFPV